MTIYVDRVSGSRAVVEYRGQSYDVPLALLPQGTEEGHLLRWEVERDEAAEAERRARARSRMSNLIDDDDGGDFSL